MKTQFLLPVISGVYLMLSLSLVRCNSAPSRQHTKDSLEIELDSLVPRLLTENNVPGFSLAVIRNSEVVWTKAYGLADKSNKTQVTVNTKFNIGSVSKTITAMAVLILAENGKIELDAPVDKYLKRWHLPPGKYNVDKVTIRRVLSHTAGLSVSGYHGVFKPGDRLPTLIESLNGYQGSDGALEIIQEPGTTFRYSSGGYTLLQLLIEDVTGISFDDYVQQKLFVPLSLKNTMYEWSAELEKTAATPYDENGKPWSHFQSIEHASGGVYTTAADLGRILTALFHNTKQHYVIKRESAFQMITPASATNEKYGLGCKIFPINEKQKLIFHDGANEGWRAAYYIHPSTGDGVVMLVNSDFGGRIGAPVICAVFKRTAVDMSVLCSTLKK